MNKNLIYGMTILMSLTLYSCSIPLKFNIIPIKNTNNIQNMEEINLNKENLLKSNNFNLNQNIAMNPDKISESMNPINNENNNFAIKLNKIKILNKIDSITIGNANILRLELTSKNKEDLKIKSTDVNIVEVKKLNDEEIEIIGKNTGIAKIILSLEEEIKEVEIQVLPSSNVYAPPSLPDNSDPSNGNDEEGKGNREVFPET